MKQGNHSADSIINFILEIFAQRGAQEYMGETVPMSQHMEQSAACAVADDAPDSLVVSAPLHDIGHFVGKHPIEALENGIDNNHQTVGARYLEACFPASICEPIRLHVSAKRYLCATNNGDLGRLSDASVSSLNIQGGPMNRAEVVAFETNPYHQDAVRLRLYDDDGKAAGLTIKPVTEYHRLLESCVSI